MGRDFISMRVKTTLMSADEVLHALKLKTVDKSNGVKVLHKGTIVSLQNKPITQPININAT